MIYVDLGAYNGDTVEQFINWGQLFGDISDAAVFAFDPQKYDEWEDVRKRHIKHVKDIQFFDRAAWTHGKGLYFSLNDIGSTVMQDKNTWDKSHVRAVKSFDFSAWLKKLKDPEIYIKMDIEGAEYPVLRKMIEDGTDKLCTLLMIEWHAGKMGDKWRKEEEWIKDNINCEWIEWR